MNKLYEVVIANASGVELTFMVVARDEDFATRIAYLDLELWQKEMHKEQIDDSWQDSIREITDDFEDQKSYLVFVKE